MATRSSLHAVSCERLDASFTRDTSSGSFDWLLYSLQIAASNLKRLTFHETPQQMAVDQPAESADYRRKEACSYETLDPDLKLGLLEISNEVDRRLREKSSRPEVLTTEDTKEHGGGTNAAGPSADC